MFMITIKVIVLLIKMMAIMFIVKANFTMDLFMYSIMMVITVVVVIILMELVK